MKIGKITDIKGITVGHYTNKEKGTGCTVLLCENGATGGVDVRGTAPGTRETDLLKSGQLVEKIHGISLSGGSAFGLDTAGGVMRYLVEKNVGYNIGTNVIPIVPSAILCAPVHLSPLQSGYLDKKGHTIAHNPPKTGVRPPRLGVLGVVRSRFGFPKTRQSCFFSGFPRAFVVFHFFL